MISKLVFLFPLFGVLFALPPHLEKRVVDGLPLDFKLPGLLTFRNDKGNHICGANLISDPILIDAQPNTYYAVTAAHCVFPYDKNLIISSFTLSANRFDIRKTDLAENGVKFTILDYMMHPQYNHKTYVNDFTVLKLQPTEETKSNLDQLKFIQFPASDPNNAAQSQSAAGQNNQKANSDFFSGLVRKYKSFKDSLHGIDNDNSLNANLFSAGWGTTDIGGTTAVPIVLGAQMKVTDKKACLAEYSIPPTLTDTIICAVGANQLSDTCKGDSGGPLYEHQGDQFILIGVVSYGKGCGSKEFNHPLVRSEIPGVYSNAYYFYPFFKQCYQKMNQPVLGNQVQQSNQTLNFTSTVQQQNSQYLLEL